MSTEKQTAANRLNAKKSTGPNTPAGKARSAWNGLQSGIYAKSLLLPDEKLEDLRALITEYYVFHTPRTPAARAAVDNLIRAEWLSRRLANIDTQLLIDEISSWSGPYPGCTTSRAFAGCESSLNQVQRRITATDNLYHRNLKVYRTLQPDPEIESDASETDAPAPEDYPHDPSEPALSTAQTVEVQNKTQQLASFLKITPTPAPSHPADFEDCPNCRNLGYRSPHCQYQRKMAS